MVSYIIFLMCSYYIESGGKSSKNPTKKPVIIRHSSEMNQAVMRNFEENSNF